MFSRRAVWAGISALSVLFLAGVAVAQGPEALDLGEGNQQPGADFGGQEIHLELGEQTVISAAQVKSYSEGVRGIVDVRLTRDGKQFVVVAQEAGETSLLLLMNDGSKKSFRIQVGSGAPAFTRGDEAPLTVKSQDNVRLDFYFVELDRSDNFRVGVGYPGSVSMGSFSGSFDFLTQSFQAATAVVEDQALLRLDMAQASGFAKLSRRAAVITENGKPAVFSGGGEVNIAVEGSLTTGIHQIAFGSTIEVLPFYDVESSRLRIQLKADVSDLTDDRGSGAPGRVTSSISTVVNLEVGQAVVLAGLEAESVIKSRTGVPFLSQMPILGYLFGTERVTKNASDTVVFIVPSVVDATTPNGRRKVKEAFEAYEDYGGGAAEQEKLRRQWRDK